MQEIRCALDKGIGLAELAAEFEKPALAQTIVGNISAKIVQGLPRMVLVGEHNSRASRAILRCFSNFSAFAAWAFSDVALLIEDNRLSLNDSFASARQKYIKKRQGAEDRPCVQLPSHIIGLKKKLRLRMELKRPFCVMGSVYASALGLSSCILGISPVGSKPLKT